MARSTKRTVLALVPNAEGPKDQLAAKLDSLALSIANELASADLMEKLDGLKVLSAYWTASRKGMTVPGAVPENAFVRYRQSQAGEDE